MSFENPVGKGEIAHNDQLFPFQTVFSTCLKNFMPFSSTLKTVVCKVFQFARVQNLLFWKEFNIIQPIFNC